MILKKVAIIISAFCLLAAIHENLRPNVKIDGGEFVPLYGVTAVNQKFKVAPFRLDIAPVTNQEFLAFVKKHPEWKPRTQAKLLADAQYLKHWNVKGAPEKSDLNKPVTNISYFAASDFCVASHGRLPTVLEWEYVAAASDTAKDASRDPKFVQQLLDWYGKPFNLATLGAIMKDKPNAWGVYDIHRLVWEWNADFNSVFVAGDNRRDGEQLKNLYCGDSAASSSDRANYAAFMRYAMRSSLRGEYTTENLGFRCAYDIETNTK